jgi:hypothetical protein
MSKNDITGDNIRTKGILSPEGEKNYDNIFRKNKVAQCPNIPEPCFCTGACKGEVTSTDGWDEDRIDVIGQNGNSGEHY